MCDTVNESIVYEPLAENSTTDSSISFSTSEISTIAEPILPPTDEFVSQIFDQHVPSVVSTRPHRSRQLPAKFQDYTGLPRHLCNLTYQIFNMLINILFPMWIMF